VAKLVWRVKLVAELEPGVVTETELARIERDAQASVAELGLRLDEAKRLRSPPWAHAVACARPAGACWSARATTGRRSAPCSATCRSGWDGGLPVPARVRT
jgi:hypothetical protein